MDNKAFVLTDARYNHEELSGYRLLENRPSDSLRMFINCYQYLPFFGPDVGEIWRKVLGHSAFENLTYGENCPSLAFVKLHTCFYHQAIRYFENQRHLRYAQNTRYKILLHAVRSGFGVCDQLFMSEHFVAVHVNGKKCPPTVMSQV